MDNIKIPNSIPKEVHEEYVDLMKKIEDALTECGYKNESNQTTTEETPATTD